jgi:ubiquitin-protein ligase
MSRTVKKNVTFKSRAKALFGNFKRCTIKDVHPHIKFIMTEDDVHNWYFMMGAMVDADNKGEFSGNNDEFLKGQFLGKITATNTYPFGPPDVEMLTPTGVFPLNNNNFCIDIGKYHKENYPATLGMDGYTKMIWSGLVGWRDLGYGINLISGRIPQNKQVEMIRKASCKSQAYNRKNNADLVELFRGADKHKSAVKYKKTMEKKVLKKKKVDPVDPVVEITKETEQLKIKDPKIPNKNMTQKVYEKKNNDEDL